MESLAPYFTGGWRFSGAGCYTHQGYLYIAGRISNAGGTKEVGQTILTGLPPALRPVADTPITLLLDVVKTTDTRRDPALTVPLTYASTVYTDGHWSLDAPLPEQVNVPPAAGTYFHYDPNIPAGPAAPMDTTEEGYLEEVFETAAKPRYSLPLSFGLIIANSRWPLVALPPADAYVPQSLAAFLGPDFEDIDSTIAVHTTRVHLGGHVRAKKAGAQLLLASLPEDAASGIVADTATTMPTSQIAALVASGAVLLDTDAVAGVGESEPISVQVPPEGEAGKNVNRGLPYLLLPDTPEGPNRTIYGHAPLILTRYGTEQEIRSEGENAWAGGDPPYWIPNLGSLGGNSKQFKKGEIFETVHFPPLPGSKAPIEGLLYVCSEEQEGKPIERGCVVRTPLPVFPFVNIAELLATLFTPAPDWFLVMLRIGAGDPLGPDDWEMVPGSPEAKCEPNAKGELAFCQPSSKIDPTVQVTYKDELGVEHVARLFELVDPFYSRFNLAALGEPAKKELKEFEKKGFAPYVSPGTTLQGVHHIGDGNLAPPFTGLDSSWQGWLAPAATRWLNGSSPLYPGRVDDFAAREALTDFLWTPADLDSLIASQPLAQAGIAQAFAVLQFYPFYKRRQIGLRAGDVLDLTGCGWQGFGEPTEGAEPPGEEIPAPEEEPEKAPGETQIATGARGVAPF